MKRLLIPCIILLLVIAAGYRYCDGHKRQAVAAARAAEQTSHDVIKLTATVNALQARLAAGSAEAAARTQFLTKWQEAYKAQQAFDGVLRSLATQDACQIINMNQTDVSVALGERQLKGKKFTREFQAGYSSLLRLLGDYEASLDLASTDTITFTKSVQENLTMNVQFTLPALNFDSIANAARP